MRGTIDVSDKMPLQAGAEPKKASRGRPLQNILDFLII